MKCPKVYDKIKQFAQELSATLSVYSFVYGAIKLATMSPIMRDKVLFKGQEEQNEIAKIIKLIAENELDKEEALANISRLAKQSSDASKKALDKITASCEAKSSDYSAAALLKAILKADLLQLQETPAEEISPTQQNRLRFNSLIGKARCLYQSLTDRIQGQDEAIRLFVQGYFHSQVLQKSAKYSERPQATFLFAGPEGVGKATLAEAAAQSLGLPCLKIELNEYIVDEAYATQQLFASLDEGGLPGKVTAFVDKNPNSLLIFNDLDKANAKLVITLTQMLETGKINDRVLRKSVSFKDTVIIFTSSLGKAIYLADRERNLTVVPRPVVLDAFKKELTHGLYEETVLAFILNQFTAGNIILFNYLSTHYLMNIVKESFALFSQSLMDTYNLKAIIDPKLVNIFLYTQCNSLDAHTAALQSQTFLKDELYELIRHLDPASEIMTKLENISFKVQLPKDASTLRQLLSKETRTTVLVIADKEKFPKLPRSSKLELCFADSYKEALELLRLKDIDYCIIDLCYKQDKQAQRFLSLDDIASVGIECFERLRAAAYELPIYLLEHNNMATEDMATFLQRGAREFLKLDTNAEAALQSLEEIGQQIYMQGKLDMLNVKGKIIAFNTSQEIVDEGKTIEITFYDFYLRNAQTMDNEHLSVVSELHPQTKLTNIIGAKKAKEELLYLSQYLLAPRKFVIEAGKAPSGILLYGMPDSGKASLAHALAGQADAAFISVEASLLLSFEASATIEYIDTLFLSAKQCAPSVIFIDGLELLACGQQPIIDTLRNRLLKNIESCQKDIRHPILFVGAIDWATSHLSNDEDELDSTLLRHLDHKLYVSLPEKEERKQYLTTELAKHHIKNISENAITNISERTTGATIASLADFLALAIHKAKRANEALNDELFISTLDEYIYGEKREWTAIDYEDTAIHESGHAYLNWLSGRRNSFVTIISRGDYGGYTLPETNEQGESSPTRQDIIWKIRMMLAGRAAEIVFFGEEMGTNTGITSDLQMATNWALHMICRCGMDEYSLVSLDPALMLQTSMSGEILQRVSQLLQQELKTTIEIVKNGKAAVKALADELLAKNQLTGPEIEAIFERYKK